MLWWLIFAPVLAFVAFWVLMLNPIIGGIAIICLTVIAIIRMLIKRR